MSSYNFDYTAPDREMRLPREVASAQTEFLVNDVKDIIAKRIAAEEGELSYWDYETGQKVEEQWGILHEDNTLKLDPDKFSTQVKSLTSKISRFLQELKTGKGPEEAGGEAFTSAPPMSELTT